jgi:hypothetical protein
MPTERPPLLGEVVPTFATTSSLVPFSNFTRIKEQIARREIYDFGSEI